MTLMMHRSKKRLFNNAFDAQILTVCRDSPSNLQFSSFQILPFKLPSHLNFQRVLLRSSLNASITECVSLKSWMLENRQGFKNSAKAENLTNPTKTLEETKVTLVKCISSRLPKRQLWRAFQPITADHRPAVCLALSFGVIHCAKIPFERNYDSYCALQNAPECQTM